MKVGSQLYNIGRVSLPLESKLGILKILGYDAVELCGFNGTDYEGLPAETLKKILDDLGLEVVGAHVGYGRFLDSMENLISYHKALGVHWLAIPRPMPYFPEGTDFTIIREAMQNYPQEEDFDGIMDNLKAFAKALREEGLDLYYHTHDHEYKPREKDRLIDRILNETDIKLEVDICWGTKVGALSDEELFEFINEHKDRIMALHLKGNDNNVSCPLDQGQLDIAKYYHLAEALGHEYTVVEDDTQLPDPITGICRSMMAIKKFQGEGEN